MGAAVRFVVAAALGLALAASDAAAPVRSGSAQGSTLHTLDDAEHPGRVALIPFAGPPLR
jgi:hypothetical protein